MCCVCCVVVVCWGKMCTSEQAAGYIADAQVPHTRPHNIFLIFVMLLYVYLNKYINVGEGGTLTIARAACLLGNFDSFRGVLINDSLYE